jgi:hypothetical protein
MKLRVWNGKRMLFNGPGGFCDFEIHGGAVYVWDDCGYDIHKQDHPLMQFTGLVDKHGVDVFEGDILDFDPMEWGGELIEAVPSINCLIGDWPMCGSPADISEFRAVVGNIHQNPELLT